MTKLRLYKYGEKVLREKAVNVAEITEELRELAFNMIDMMHSSNGVGLAAQQVGHLERLCVIDIPEGSEATDELELFNASVAMPLILFNPEIISRNGSQCGEEGCLSFPGLGGRITRAMEVSCAYLDECGTPKIITARGLLARALQHEIDHLNGILYVDHMTAAERLVNASKLKKLAKANGGAR